MWCSYIRPFVIVATFFSAVKIFENGSFRIFILTPLQLNEMGESNIFLSVVGHY